MAFLSGIGKWLLSFLVDWLFGKLKSWWAKRQALKKAQEERAEANKQAEEKLEKAKTESEIIDAASNVLKR